MNEKNAVYSLNRENYYYSIGDDKAMTLPATDYTEPQAVIEKRKTEVLSDQGGAYIDSSPTLRAEGHVPDVMDGEGGSVWVIRKLTPRECGRLQGMPDWWCSDVPHSDAAEYKMWGNGVALPCVLFLMEGIAEELKKQEEDGNECN